MNVIVSKGLTRMLAISLGPSELLLESIREAVRSYRVRDGVVMSGVGTLKRCCMHYVDTTGFPPVNKFYVVEEPLEVASISGIIADYEPHLHISVGCRDEKTYAGHLEEGCVVLYLAEVLIMMLDGLTLTRRLDKNNVITLLEERTQKVLKI